MKKYFIILIFFNIVLTLTSCKNENKITVNNYNFEIKLSQTIFPADFISEYEKNSQEDWAKINIKIIK